MGKTKSFLRAIRNYNYERLKQDVKFWLFFGVIIFALILFLTGTIRIVFTAGSEESSILYTLLNALVFGVFINSLGIFNKGIKGLKIKLGILIVAIIVVLTGFGYFDVQIHFNLWFFAYKIYSSSSAHGIYFFWLNLYFWSIIYFISFITESEDFSNE